MYEYEIHKLTGAVLTGANGESQGNESAGVVSRSSHHARARRKLAEYRRDCPHNRYELRCNGERVEE